MTLLVMLLYGKQIITFDGQATYDFFYGHSFFNGVAFGL